MDINSYGHNHSLRSHACIKWANIDKFLIPLGFISLPEKVSSLLYQKNNVIIPDFKWTLLLLTFSCIAYFWMQPNATWKNFLVLLKLFICILAKYEQYLSQDSKVHTYLGKVCTPLHFGGTCLLYNMRVYLFRVVFFCFWSTKCSMTQKRKKKKISFHVEWWMQQLDWV